LDAAFMAKQYVLFGKISDGMVLAVSFQFIYVWDALWNESKVLSTMDITSDGFGFMLVAGDILWVPFLYSLQARYLSMHQPDDLGWTIVGLIVGLNALGYYIFRSANSEKDLFRSNSQDPKVRHLRTMTTKSGSKLLISGWWGYSRHINYFGDWIMAIAWSLTCGFHYPIPYFYPIYFAILLIHRFYRDEQKCRLKYGSDWDRYCELVPWKIIPYIF
jgi:protein-S-isoprenylcysteine O-methyltransferase Ste14